MISVKKGVFSVLVLFLCLSFDSNSMVGSLSRWSNVDPSPAYSSGNPYDFMRVQTTSYLKEGSQEYCDARIRFSFSPFYQRADKGKPKKCIDYACLKKCTGIDNTPSGTNSFETVCNCKEDGTGKICQAELGDLGGPWNINALFYNEDTREKLCEGLSLDCTNSLKRCLIYEDEIDKNLELNLLTDPAGADYYKNFARYSVPIKYRKYGLRFSTEFAFCRGITLKFFTGFAHIKQTPCFIDRTCAVKNEVGRSCPVCKNTVKDGEATHESEETTKTSSAASTECNSTCCLDCPDCPCRTLVVDKIMKKQSVIADVLNVDIKEFDKRSWEDTEINLCFSKICPMNADYFGKDFERWHYFLFTPFLNLGFTIPTGSKTFPDEDKKRNLFALSSGNNGHWSFGGSFGFTIDFRDSVALGTEFGLTGFNTKDHRNVPIPDNNWEAGIFSKYLDMQIRPGLNWKFVAYMGTRYFLENLSVNLQYEFIGHQKDTFEKISTEPKLDDYLVYKGPANKDDPNIRRLEELSSWHVHLFNFGLNYDLSSCLQMGIVWQIPLSQRNAYRATTFLGSIQFVF